MSNVIVITVYVITVFKFSGHRYCTSWVCSRDHSDILFIGTMYVNEDMSHMDVNTPHQIVAMG